MAKCNVFGRLDGSFKIIYQTTRNEAIITEITKHQTAKTRSSENTKHQKQQTQKKHVTSNGNYRYQTQCAKHQKYQAPKSPIPQQKHQITNMC